MNGGCIFRIFALFTLNRCDFMRRQLVLQDQFQLCVSLVTASAPPRAVYLDFKHQTLTQLGNSCVACWVFSLSSYYYYSEHMRTPKRQGVVVEKNVERQIKKIKKNNSCKGSRPSMTSEDKRLRTDFSGGGDSSGLQAGVGGGQFLQQRHQK